MTHARRADAGFGEPVVKPGGGTVAQVGADGLVNRAEHLEQNECGANQRERPRKAASALDGADEDAHGDGQHGGQHAS